MLHGEKPWPATSHMLEEWAANRVFGSSLPKQGQVKPDTVQNYLSGLKSYHIDCRLSLSGFDSPRMALIIKGGKRLFPSKKRNRRPITKDILEKITEDEPLTVDDLNADTAFKVAWAGFLRLGEITYTATEAKKASFKDKKVTRSDISFSEGDQYAILRLKRSKTDTEHTGVQIVLAATGEKTCPVNALRRLFIQDPRPADAPLFRFSSSAFSRQNVVAILKKRIASIGLSDTSFSGHSFRKGAAQHAADHGMLDENIQRLGRWTSNAFKLYFTTTRRHFSTSILVSKKACHYQFQEPRSQQQPGQQTDRSQRWYRTKTRTPHLTTFTYNRNRTTTLGTFFWAARSARPGNSLPLPGNAPRLLHLGNGPPGPQGVLLLSESPSRWPFCSTSTSSHVPRCLARPKSCSCPKIQ